ncbi:MAG TPA: hypothetical protein VEY67_03980 [Candidatus Dormibacteraeota bacterium]|nr:hypothetical protein [Candidatus Dormibacteraeota bacterium]
MSAGRGPRGSTALLLAGAGCVLVGLIAAAIAVTGTFAPRPAATAASSGPSAAGGATGPPSAAPLEFQPVSLDGTGDRRAAFDIPEGAAAIAHLAHPGAGAFRVQSLGAGDARGEVLVDETGAYSGTVLFDALLGQHSIAFDVRSAGPWSVRIVPVGLATPWSGDLPLAGAGDDVVLLDAPADGTTVLHIEHPGSGRIRVLAYTDTGELDQLVDTSGALDETHEVPPGTVCLEVRAVGGWTLSPG